MAALTQPRNTPQAIGGIFGFPVKAGAKCFQGGLAVLAAGFAAPGSVAAGLVAVGRFEETADNTTGIDGALMVPVRTGVFKFANHGADAITSAEVGSDCYVVDDQTVAKTHAADTRSRAGKVVAVDADGVWVQIGLGL